VTTALTHTTPHRRAIQALLASFLDGRSPHTLTAYGRDLDDFARFLTGSRQEALGRFFAQSAPAANGDVCFVTPQPGSDPTENPAPVRQVDRTEPTAATEKRRLRHFITFWDCCSRIQ